MLSLGNRKGGIDGERRKGSLQLNEAVCNLTTQTEKKFAPHHCFKNKTKMLHSI
jgi:hypothetical protein